MTTPDTLELRIERVRQMIVECEAEPDMPMMLAASICTEHASDLRALLDRLDALEGLLKRWRSGLPTEALEDITDAFLSTTLADEGRDQ